MAASGEMVVQIVEKDYYATMILKKLSNECPEEGYVTEGRLIHV